MLSLLDYDFHLPSEKIAKDPASPRDSAKLFVYNTKNDEIAIDTFINIDKYLPKPALLVMNNTKVVPARLHLRKEFFPTRRSQRGGGRVEVLLMMNEYQSGSDTLKGVADHRLTLGTKLFFVSGDHLEVISQEEQFFFFKPSTTMEKLWDLLYKEGHTPIPPYIKDSTLKEKKLRERYQSILAAHPASVAAPTASLHFTQRLLQKLERKNIKRSEVTLHVGAGTFIPITEKNITEKKLFNEFYEIPQQAARDIQNAKDAGIPVIPVGTTALRAIETAAGGSGRIRQIERSKTDIFIFPPYEFKIADGLITNFHVPKSSLILLVEAMLMHKKAKRTVLELYDIAIKKDIRFYSFGDGMLIL